MGAKRGGGQIIYGLDVGKGEMRFCGFLGLDTFHTEIVWCEAPSICKSKVYYYYEYFKKGNPKKQRSKESCIPTQHTTHHTPH